MKEIDAFQKMRHRKGRFTLRTKVTIMIAAIVMVSTLVSYAVEKLLVLLFPAIKNAPDIVQLSVLSLIVSVILGRLAVSVFTDPIQNIQRGIQKVANGDYTVHLETRHTLKEIEEMTAGFNLMTEELRSTEILQTSFVTNVSHEFKTPISAIEGYTTLLQGTQNIDEVENAYIEKILFNTRRLSSLVSNILLLSKIENQTIQTNRQTYALDEQIREVLLSMEAAWEPKSLDFDVDLESICYYGSESLMTHVWSNLLGNAIKFSPKGGLIKLRLLRKEKQILFYIEDQGPGLNEEAQKHIFDKFYQEDTSHKEEGNGLGLALVKRILSNTGGSITAENIPEGGCRFTVILKT